MQVVSKLYVSPPKLFVLSNSCGVVTWDAVQYSNMEDHESLENPFEQTTDDLENHMQCPNPLNTDINLSIYDMTCTLSEDGHFEPLFHSLSNVITLMSHIPDVNPVLEHHECAAHQTCISHHNQHCLGLEVWIYSSPACF